MSCSHWITTLVNLAIPWFSSLFLCEAISSLVGSHIHTRIRAPLIPVCWLQMKWATGDFQTCYWCPPVNPMLKVWSSGFVCSMLFSCLNVLTLFINSSQWVFGEFFLLFEAMTRNAAKISVVYLVPKSTCLPRRHSSCELLNSRANISSDF